jgi:hypothetical protein
MSYSDKYLKYGVILSLHVASTLICPPTFVNFIALDKKLDRTWFIRRESAYNSFGIFGSIKEVIDLLKDGISVDKVSNMKYFISAFGRGQSYVSFVKDNI